MTTLRILATALVIAAIVDPAVPTSRRLPVPVRMYAATDDGDVSVVASELRRALAGRVDVVEAGPGVANVVVGTASALEAVRSAKPLSVVSIETPPSVSIVRVPSAVTLLPGSLTGIPVELEGAGVTGQTTHVVLEQDGVELARKEQAWTADGHVALTLPYAAPTAGGRRLTVRALPLPGEHRAQDNRADLLAMAADRRGRVGVVEPRPSWAAGFVRRALEGDSAFAVSSVMRVSTGIASRTGEAPPVIQPQQLWRFDALIVGAPEELSRNEVETLWQFAEQRGGTLVLLPDRVPAGPYAARLPGKWSEQLLAEPRLLEPAGVLASEVLALSAVPAGGRALASIGGAPVILSWQVGDGRIILGGALDAWRYRGDPKSRMTRFWRDELLSATLSAPPAVKIDIAPSVVRPGETVRVEVRLRRTELEDGDRTELPALEARASDSAGAREIIRLWPGAEPGLFHGTLTPSRAGIQTVRVQTPSAAAESSFLVDADAAPAADRRPASLDGVPGLTGGVTVDRSRLEPLIRHLSELPRPSARVSQRLFRSGWVPWIFAALLCAEWTLRRRAGLR